MADVLTERRKPTHHLKRSKSVRASLRFIGTKFLTNHKNNNDDNLQKSPSMSSLHDYKSTFFNGDERRHQYSILPEFYAKEPVETILKTPMAKLEPKPKMRKNEKIKVSTPPPVIAPKAAQILQIPIKENCEPLSLIAEGELVGDSNGFVCQNGLQCRGKNYDEFNFDYRHNGFHRTSLRLSMMGATKRKNNARNSSFVECPSTYVHRHLFLEL